MDKNANLNKQINAFEEYYLRAQKEEIRKIINNEVYEVLCGNGTPEQAKENISEAFHSLTSLVKNLMRTIASYHMISAQIDVLKKWGIKEYQIVAEQDLRTCIKCREMSGRHFKVEECKVMQAAPPFHFNCRCKIIPYRIENDIGSLKQNINLFAISEEEETRRENEMEPLEIPWGTKKDNSQITNLGGTSIQNVPENIFRKIASMGIGFIPIVGDIKDIQEVLTGYDIVAGEKLTWVDRGITLACVFLPIVNGKAVREGLGLADEGIRIAKGISKNMDEGIEAISKHADEAAQGVGNLAKRDELLKAVQNDKLKNAINEIYRPGATTGDGGLADAVRYELTTGEFVGGKSHILKATERVTNLENIINKQNISQNDLNIAKSLLDDLRNALGGK